MIQKWRGKNSRHKWVADMLELPKQYITLTATARWIYCKYIFHSLLGINCLKMLWWKIQPNGHICLRTSQEKNKSPQVMNQVMNLSITHQSWHQGRQLIYIWNVPRVWWNILQLVRTKWLSPGKKNKKQIHRNSKNMLLMTCLYVTIQLFSDKFMIFSCTADRLI